MGVLLYLTGPALAAPNPPSNLFANELSSSEIELTWKDNSTNEAAFSIWRSLDADSYQWVTDVLFNSVQYVDRGLESGTRYFYYIRAKNVDGTSAPSNRADATTLQSPPPAPADADATTDPVAISDH